MGEEGEEMWRSPHDGGYAALPHASQNTTTVDVGLSFFGMRVSRYCGLIHI